ncbi:MAG: DUF2247 family protein [Rubinisphaera brasiliensis]|uniref:DUF2247 family protein n=1 Tax=Rubinisphaera brasiliensis TaxID=119 RepID=UPI00391BECCE
MARRTIEVLENLNLLGWDVLIYGRQRGWVTIGDLNRFATTYLNSDLNDHQLRAVAKLTSAEKLPAWEIDHLPAQLGPNPLSRDSATADYWRLAKLVELHTQDLDWDEKVTQLESLAAEFGFPKDMQGCSRYSVGTADPLDEMESVIAKLKNQLGPG